MESVFTQQAERKLRRQVRRHELPDYADELVEEYETSIGARDRFLWKWLDLLFPKFTLSCVPSRQYRRIGEAKLLASVYVVFLDDLAEKQHDRATFEEASKIPFGHQSPNFDRPDVDEESLEFGESVWARLEEILEEAPRWDEFEDIFYFDVKQTVNAIEYTDTANRHVEMHNSDENEIYDPPNMTLFSYVNVDLLHSPSFERTDLAPLRRAVLRAQQMVRIGNWVTTWEREIEEGDFSSGVVVYAMENGVVSRSELERLRDSGSADERERVVRAVKESGIEDAFLGRAERIYDRIASLESEVASVDLSAFLTGVADVFEYQLASRGLK